MSQDVLSNMPEPVSVTELSHDLKRTLEQKFDFVRVRGELSKVKIYASGHLYTDLKDENSVINAVCWRGVLNTLSIRPEEGLEVICTGKITTYPARSNYQLVIESMELAGEGALLKMLEERKKKLQAEGLFDAERKKPIPFLPRSIGVITSPSGAVIHDILHRLEDRFPLPVLLWPATVQGANTVRDVIAGIQAFNNLPDDMRPDILIIARGGGSLEDLMPFNEEAIIRAVAESNIPVISAVGHETDTTLIDFVSDRRAPTPTAAAEMAVPVLHDLRHGIAMHQQRLTNMMDNRLKHSRSDIRDLQRRLGDPIQILNIQYQKLDYLLLQAQKNMGQIVNQFTTRFVKATVPHPRLKIEHGTEKLHTLSQRLVPSVLRYVEKTQTKLGHSASLLETLSFKNTLARGYAVVKNTHGKLVTNAADAKAQEALQIQFADDVVTTYPSVEKSKTLPKKKPADKNDKSEQGTLL